MAATEIILVPDIFFHNWETPTGQAWLCLRPLVRAKGATETSLGPLADFSAWALGCEGSGTAADPRFTYLEPRAAGLTGARCGPGDQLLPVNLPSDVAMEVRIGRRAPSGGTAEPEQLLEVRRDRERRTVRSTSADRLFGAAGDKVAFVRLFNTAVAEQFRTYQQLPDRQHLAFTFMQRMEAGRRIGWNAQEIEDLGAHGVFDVREPAAATTYESGLYWMLGLMAPLGSRATAADLDRLQRIERIDIELVQYDLDTGARLGRVGGINMPNFRVGWDSTARYFSQVSTTFTRTLQGRFTAHDGIVYVGPGNRPLQQPADDGPADVWRAPGAGAVADAEDLATRRRAQLEATGTLKRLAALELRTQPTGNAATDAAAPPPPEVTFEPGLLAPGRLEPYRRFPRLLATAEKAGRVATVLQFEPDADVALALQQLYRALTARGGASAFKAAFDAAIGAPVRGWKLELLHAGTLPWDGPNPRFRVLATPDGGNVAVGAPRTFEPRGVQLFFAAPPGPRPAELRGKRQVWATRATSVAALASQWDTDAPGWQELVVNAVRIAPTSGAPVLGGLLANALFVDDFSFFAAESVARMEQVLTLRASGPEDDDSCPTGDPDDPNNTPARDYEDDLVNFNTMRVVNTVTGLPLSGGEVLRRPERLAGEEVKTAGGVRRTQSIPFVHGWRRDPRDKAAPEDIQHAVRWEDVRDFMAGLVLPAKAPLDAGPFRADFEHTYGPTIAAADAGGVATARRSTSLDTPVWLPTFAEVGDQAFLTCAYHDGGGQEAIVLTLDERLLLQAAAPANATPEELRRYALGVSAWRAIADLGADGARCALVAELSTFDLRHVLDPTSAAGVGRFASGGFPGDWANAVRPDAPKTFDESVATDLTALRRRAADLLKGVAQPSAAAPPITVRLPAGPHLGALAHLLRIRLQVTRAPAQASNAKSRLVSIRDQPGFTPAPDTLQAVWLQLNVDAGLPWQDGAKEPSPGIRSGYQAFLAERRTSSDSVNVAKQPPPPPVAARETPLARQRRLAAEQAAVATNALVAQLDGTDWFPPEGAGPMAAVGLRVEPLLVPMGFAPCSPDNPLGVVSQTALQRLAVAVRDAIDLAYEPWAEAWEARGRSAAGLWHERFAKIARLGASPGAAPAPGDQRLATLARLIAERLTFAQPADHDETEPDIRALANAINSSTGGLRWMSQAVARRLVADPALFADAKALLLTVLRFKEDTTLVPTPEAGRLARGRFRRLVDDRASGQPGRTGGVDAPLTATLTLEHLVPAFLSEPAPSSTLRDGLAFLEPLDDALYSNVFRVPVGPQHGQIDYRVESFEELIDPVKPEEEGKPPEARPPVWPQKPPKVPALRHNAGGGARPVHLASRALVTAPNFHFGGASEKLQERVETPGSTWDVDGLVAGYRDPAGRAVGKALRIAARWDKAVALGADDEVVFSVYGVRGDEEGAVTAQAFANDGLLVRLTDTGPSAALVPSAAPPSYALAEEALRRLLFEPRGSQAAAEAIEGFMLNVDPNAPEAFERVMEDMIRPALAPLPEASYALVRLAQDAAGRDVLNVSAPNAAPTYARLRHALLLETDLAPGEGMERIAYLVTGYRADVWTRQQFELVHARNIPFAEWGGSDPADPEPRFARQFWQAAPQQAIPSKPRAPVTWANTADDWSATRVVWVDKAWRGVPVRVRDVVDRFLRSRDVAVGKWTSGDPLLGAGSPWTSSRLSISVNAEVFTQFGYKPNALPDAGPGLVYDADRPDPDAMRMFFPADLGPASISFAWTSRSGVRFFEIARIFIDFR